MMMEKWRNKKFLKVKEVKEVEERRRQMIQIQFLIIKYENKRKNPKPFLCHTPAPIYSAFLDTTVSEARHTPCCTQRKNQLWKYVFTKKGPVAT